MKNLKKPTYDQKKRINKAGLDWTEWLVKKDIGEITIVNKATGEVKVI